MRNVVFSLLFFVPGILCAQKGAEKAFTDIYRSGYWHDQGFSLSGAEIEPNEGYVAFLQEFMAENEIHRVIDLGCGDWQFSQYIDWNGIWYTGYDVVKYVIERNQNRFGQPCIEFIHADAIESELPEADLLICKDVLQHLPNSDILKLLKQFHKFKHCLITNDVNPRTLSSDNRDILRGKYRPLDLTLSPFHLAGEKVLTFQAAGFSIKQVLHIQKLNSIPPTRPLVVKFPPSMK